MGILELVASGGDPKAEAHVQDDWPADPRAGKPSLQLLDPYQRRGVHHVTVS